MEDILLLTSGDAGFNKLIEEPLTKTRRGLAADTGTSQPWPLLPLMACESICGHYEQIIPAAASLQLFKAAADVFDDIEDADSPDSLAARYGSDVAVNVATTLLILAERALSRLRRRGIDDNTIIHAIDTINSFYTVACTGQHLDLTLKSRENVSEELYLKIAAMKSASQIKCTCYIGALLATRDKRLMDKFAEFGHELGMASQITNDIQGIINSIDIINRRKTLPVIYALSHKDTEIHNRVETFFLQKSDPVSESQQIKKILFQTGAVHYATVKMEFYKQRAFDILSEIEETGIKTERLKVFLD